MAVPAAISRPRPRAATRTTPRSRPEKGRRGGGGRRLSHLASWAVGAVEEVFVRLRRIARAPAVDWRHVLCGRLVFVQAWRGLVREGRVFGFIRARPVFVRTLLVSARGRCLHIQGRRVSVRKKRVFVRSRRGFGRGRRFVTFCTRESGVRASQTGSCTGMEGVRTRKAGFPTRETGVRARKVVFGTKVFFCTEKAFVFTEKSGSGTNVAGFCP